MTAFPLVEVSGSSYEMGRQHGRKAADQIQRYLRWIDELAGRPRRELCANALRFAPRIQALSAEYFEEVVGLSQGAGISLEEALLCQCRAEAAQTWESACTAFALRGEATASGHPLAGQNQDLEPEYGACAILLSVRPGDGRPRALMFTFAGQLGYAGMNQFGVANFVNALYNFRWRPGLPFYPLRRLMLEQRNVARCLDLLRQQRTCSAANLVLCDGEGAIADVEVRPEGVAAWEDAHPDQRLHTNHYLTSPFARFEDGTLPDSCPRLDRIRGLVRQHWGRITVDTLKQMLADHEGLPAAICRHRDRRMDSISGYIAEPARGLLHVRRGLGCNGHWEAYKV